MSAPPSNNNYNNDDYVNKNIDKNNEKKLFTGSALVGKTKQDLASVTMDIQKYKEEKDREKSLCHLYGNIRKIAYEKLQEALSN